ncbi:MAG: TIGR03617 family F420-dependent LLM class oxidoreductase [Anaerolineae bacterium]|nr:TIGR03617 family F420-dependent LLM class oxidoreductase [Anaerolineae bacterium]MCB9103207.1 TIGR03617 family F420-dependent LLM class oxidoreductase [Anaerolineales bacterium]
MKFDAALLAADLTEIPQLTRQAEAIGFDGIWVSETAHDAFLPLVLAAEYSQRVTLGTGIAVAFPRSPAILAHIAWDLAKYSQGRFVVGLGTQVKAHNERRLGVKWEQPVAKLREVILAMRALWDCWQNGTKLNFRGEFFKLTLMTPFFNPGPHDYPDIPIYISAMNKNMLQLAGELCQGVHLHPLHTARYIKEFALPQLETGLQKRGRQRAEIELSSNVFVTPTDDAGQAKAYEAEARQQISFYASTPAYRVVMELHGWSDIAERLSRLAARGRWTEMPRLVTDEMLAEFVVSGTWAELPAKIKAKYAGGLLDRVSYYIPFVPGENEAGWQATLTGFQQD